MKIILQSVRDILAALLILFCSEIIGMMTASLIGVFAAPSVISDVFYILVNTAVYISLVFFMVTLYTRRILRGKKIEDSGNFVFRRVLKWIVITVSAQGIIILLSSLFFEGHWVILSHARVDYSLFRALFDFGIGAGIAEELIFRELLFKNFESKFGRTPAIFVISIIFAVLHIANQQENIGALLIVIYSFVLSAYLCLLYIRTNSVWECAIVHGVWNFIFMGCVSVGKANESQALVNYETTTNNYLLIPIGVVLLICIWLCHLKHNGNK